MLEKSKNLPKWDSHNQQLNNENRTCLLADLLHNSKLFPMKSQFYFLVTLAHSVTTDMFYGINNIHFIHWFLIHFFFDFNLRIVNLDSETIIFRLLRNYRFQIFAVFQGSIRCDASIFTNWKFVAMITFEESLGTVAEYRLLATIPIYRQIRRWFCWNRHNQIIFRLCSSTLMIKFNCKPLYTRWKFDSKIRTVN